ncbi:unnamed protein product [Phaedon cochleariae]|uniref:Uncharacterized protein n=1 Tax=Phaedon cochleariae TaxID=80249 RepID=A0A9P0DNV1_PHACE|nr:unnamed protein product [Phaedon cochleariae]
MEWLHFVTVLIIFGVVWCEDMKNDDSVEDDIRETRQYNQEGWRVAEKFHKGSAGWIPREEPPESLDLKLKRRRIRKRKRKPQQTEESSDDGERYIKRFHPHRLDQGRQPWEEINEEAMRSPTIRRRITPVYYSPQNINKHTVNSISTTTDSSTKNRTEPMSSTSSIMVEDQEIQRMTEPKIDHLAGLKSLLKKSRGNISLSEILQQKNLSLSELLKGGEHAISALTEKPVTTTLPTKSVYSTETEPSTKYKRLPPSIALTKTTDRNYVLEDQSFETLTDQETVEAQRKRLALLQPKENKLFSSLNEMEVVTEPTTERRIFVTSYPKSDQLKISLSSKSTAKSTPSTATTPKIDITIATESPKTEPIEMQVINREKTHLPTTNAKLRSTTKKINVNKEIINPFAFGFPEPMKISINEILGFGDDKIKEDNNDAPMRVSIDIEELIEKNKETSFTEAPTTKVVTENQTYVTARREIMEIMKDPVSRDNLSRILENRNMTLNELVEQRERGYSQRHLADIFHNSTREPEPKEEPFIGHILADSFPSFPSLTRQPKSRTFEEDIPSKILTTAKTTEAPELITSRPETASTTFGNEIKTDLSAQDIQPFPWKQLYPDLFADSVETDSKFTENDSEEETRSSERLDGSLSNEQLKPDEYDLFFQIPPGVKSALFVSLAIIGLSLVVFLTILVVFRWLQKKNRAINYCSSLSSKIRSPIIIQGRPSNAIRTFVNETVRRKKNYFKSNMQSMSDEIWESSRDRKPSF